MITYLYATNPCASLVETRNLICRLYGMCEHSSKFSSPCNLPLDTRIVMLDAADLSEPSSSGIIRNIMRELHGTLLVFFSSINTYSEAQRAGIYALLDLSPQSALKFADNSDPPFLSDVIHADSCSGLLDSVHTISLVGDGYQSLATHFGASFVLRTSKLSVDIVAIGSHELFRYPQILNPPNQHLLDTLVAGNATPAARLFTASVGDILWSDIVADKPESAPHISVEAHREELNAIQQTYLSGSPDTSCEAWLERAELAYSEIPSGIRREVLRFRKHCNSASYLLIKGFPTDPALPPTPLLPTETASKQTFVAEFWLTAIATGLGEPIGYKQQKGGRLLHNITPTVRGKDAVTSESSSSALSFHSEAPFHPLAPKFIVFTCLRPEPCAYTEICSVGTIYYHSSLHTIYALEKTLFNFYCDFAGTSRGTKTQPVKAPICTPAVPYPILRFDPENMASSDPESPALLQHVLSLANAHHDRVCLEPGDIVIVNNYHCVHGRTVFNARFDGTDRWHQRIYVIPSLSTSQSPSIQHFNNIVHSDFE